MKSWFVVLPTWLLRLLLNLNGLLILKLFIYNVGLHLT